jgi:hypothetical protein
LERHTVKRAFFPVKPTFAANSSDDVLSFFLCQRQDFGAHNGLRLRHDELHLDLLLLGHLSPEVAEATS